jgi:hypothetical protein
LNRRFAVGLIAVLVLVGVQSSAVHGATPQSGTIDATTTSISWQGAHFTGGSYALFDDHGTLCFNPVTGRPYDQPFTSGPAACDVFVLNVNLDPSFWTTHAGDVRISLSGWPDNGDGLTDDIDLHVYRRNSDGSVGPFIGASGHGAGQPESFSIPSASGSYYVLAVAFAVIDSAYQGTASLELESTQEPGTVGGGLPTSRASHDIYLSHSEPHISMNPLDHDNLVAGSKMYVNLERYQFRIGTYASFNGGKTWQDNGHLPGYGDEPTPADCVPNPNTTPDQPESCSFTTSDVWTTFDDEGNAYAMVLVSPGGASGPAGWSMNLHKSSDGGRTWSQPIVIHDHFQNPVLQAVFLDDKNAVAVDNFTTVDGKPNRAKDGKIGTMYACWELDSDPGVLQELVVATSNDGGAHWSPPVAVSTTETRDIGCQISIDKRGTAYVAYFDYGNNEMRYVRSTDHGTTWSVPATIASVQPLPTNFPNQHFRNLSVPAMAYSATADALYITWPDYHTAADGTQDGDIVLSKGTIGPTGVTWSAPTRVNQDAVGNGKDQFQPAIAVTESGQVDVSYFDRRNDPGNFFVDTYLSRSDDGGATWRDTRVTHLLSSPELNAPTDAGGNKFFGDYQGLVADNRIAVPFFNSTQFAYVSPTNPEYSRYQEVVAGRVPNTPRF